MTATVAIEIDFWSSTYCDIRNIMSTKSIFLFLFHRLFIYITYAMWIFAQIQAKICLNICKQILLTFKTTLARLKKHFSSILATLPKRCHYVTSICSEYSIECGCWLRLIRHIDEEIIVISLEMPVFDRIPCDANKCGWHHLSTTHQLHKMSL